jgi:hypothetical protein
MCIIYDVNQILELKHAHKNGCDFVRFRKLFIGAVCVERIGNEVHEIGHADLVDHAVVVCISFGS